MEFAIIGMLMFFSIGLLTFTVAPWAAGAISTLNPDDKRNQQFATKMERILMRSDSKKFSVMTLVIPIVGGLAGYMFLPESIKFLGVGAFVILGFLFPSVYSKIQKRRRHQKFNDQLVDALMIMSSSFRGGLSLVQAMEAVVEEMPEPIDQEFGTVLSENKMGVALEEAFNHLYDRLPSPAMQQTITAILLARETGGNLPAIFTRIVNTIRENKKIQQNIDTLTLQGKIQGGVMSLLPVVFIVIVSTSKPDFMQHMFESPVGRGMLIYALISELIGAAIIWKISAFRDF